MYIILKNTLLIVGTFTKKRYKNIYLNNFKTMDQIIKDLESGKITLDTILSGVICKKCNKKLKPHTILQHLDKDELKKIHNCNSVLN